MGIENSMGDPFVPLRMIELKMRLRILKRLAIFPPPFLCRMKTVFRMQYLFCSKFVGCLFFSPLWLWPNVFKYK